jgi:protein-tyrosine sulfotransferase
MIKNNEPIFIGGQMKSGTTMLRMLLSRHSKIYSGLETHWFKEELLTGFSNPTNNSIDKLKQFYEVSDIDMKKIISEAENKQNFISVFFSHLLIKNNKEIWLEKTPENINHLNLIDKKWDNYKFIHVIRDFRDIYSSWKLSNKYNIEYFIDNVKRTYSELNDLLGQPTEKYLEVKYEDLVLKTRESLEKIFVFINQELEEDCTQLDLEAAKKDFKKVKEIVGKKSQTLISTQQPINKNKIGQYQKVLTSEEISLIEKELRDYLILFNYKL